MPTLLGVHCSIAYRKNIYSGPEQNWNTPKNRRLFQFCSVPALFWGVSVPCQKKRGVRRIFFCPKMHYAPGWGGNGDKNSTPTELFLAGTKLGHPQKPQVFQFCSGPVYFCLRIVTAQNKYFYGKRKSQKVKKTRRSNKIGTSNRADRRGFSPEVRCLSGCD